MLDYVLRRLPSKKRPELEPIAKAVGMSASALEKIARGYTKQPQIDTLQKLYDYLRAAEQPAPEQPAAPELPGAA